MIIVIAWHASHRWCCSKITKTDNSHHQGRIRWLDWPGDWQWSVKWKDQKFYRKRIDNVILTAWISWCSSCCIIMDGCSTRSVSSAPSGVCHPDADTHRRKKSNPIQSIEESASYEDVRVDLVFESKFGDRHRRFTSWTRVNLITPKKKARLKTQGLRSTMPRTAKRRHVPNPSFGSSSSSSSAPALKPKGEKVKERRKKKRLEAVLIILLDSCHWSKFALEASSA